MNEAADDAGVAVLYPEQSLVAKALRCWNWFSPPDLDPRGDAAEIAALTRHVIQENNVDATRVYVAGMSAGGAMAVALARAYPALYAAMGVHSGVPAGLAHDFGFGGKTRRELWIVHGGGHAWAGGNEQQRLTDASGPDASREMLRFFLQHQLLTASG